MLVLGIDPGLATTGYGFVREVDRSLVSVAYGAVRTPAHTPIAERLMQLHRELTELLEQYRPDVAAVEELFFSTNARTAIAVGQARGVVLLTLAQAGIPIAEYTPLQVKQAITGYGQADKTQVQQMVCILLNLREVPRPDDVTDALAVSVCHHHSARMAALFAP
jgi:crossover junction endodeoxyribonuclease RuvC